MKIILKLLILSSLALTVVEVTIFWRGKALIPKPTV
jgi:hypothetical protein